MNLHQGTSISTSPTNSGLAAKATSSALGRPSDPIFRRRGRSSGQQSEAGVSNRGLLHEVPGTSIGMVPSHCGAPVPLSWKILPPPAGGVAWLKAFTTT